MRLGYLTVADSVAIFFRNPIFARSSRGRVLGEPVGPRGRGDRARSPRSGALIVKPPALSRIARSSPIGALFLSLSLSSPLSSSRGVVFPSAWSSRSSVRGALRGGDGDDPEDRPARARAEARALVSREFSPSRARASCAARWRERRRRASPRVMGRARAHQRHELLRTTRAQPRVRHAPDAHGVGAVLPHGRLVGAARGGVHGRGHGRRGRRGRRRHRRRGGGPHALRERRRGERRPDEGPPCPGRRWTNGAAAVGREGRGGRVGGGAAGRLLERRREDIRFRARAVPFSDFARVPSSERASLACDVFSNPSAPLHRAPSVLSPLTVPGASRLSSSPCSSRETFPPLDALPVVRAPRSAAVVRLRVLPERRLRGPVASPPRPPSRRRPPAREASASSPRDTDSTEHVPNAVVTGFSNAPPHVVPERVRAPGSAAAPTTSAAPCKNARPRGAGPRRAPIAKGALPDAEQPGSASLEHERRAPRPRPATSATAPRARRPTFGARQSKRASSVIRPLRGLPTSRSGSPSEAAQGDRGVLGVLGVREDAGDSGGVSTWAASGERPRRGRRGRSRTASPPNVAASVRSAADGSPSSPSARRGSMKAGRVQGAEPATGARRDSSGGGRARRRRRRRAGASASAPRAERLTRRAYSPRGRGRGWSRRRVGERGAGRRDRGRGEEGDLVARVAREARDRRCPRRSRRAPGGRAHGDVRAGIDRVALRGRRERIARVRTPRRISRSARDTPQGGRRRANRPASSVPEDGQTHQHGRARERRDGGAATGVASPRRSTPRASSKATPSSASSRHRREVHRRHRASECEARARRNVSEQQLATSQERSQAASISLCGSGGCFAVQCVCGGIRPSFTSRGLRSSVFKG